MHYQRLHPLRRKLPLDRPGGKQMPERMQTILLAAGGVDDSGRALQRIETATKDIAVILDAGVTVREDEPEGAVPRRSRRPAEDKPAPIPSAHGRPLLTSGFRARRHRFRVADLAPQIGTLPHMTHIPLEISIVPWQAAQFRCAHPGEDRRYEERPPPTLGLRQ